MPIMEQIVKDLTQAMKAKAQLKLDTLRMMKSALKNREIEVGHPLEDAEVIKSLTTMLKQRREAADQYLKGNRNDLADKELAEAQVIEAYLPVAMSTEELTRIVAETITELGVSSPKDIGLVMKTVMAKVAGQAVDGKAINAIVKQKLG